jgi:hypothetical protein
MVLHIKPCIGFPEHKYINPCLVVDAKQWTNGDISEDEISTKTKC